MILCVGVMHKTLLSLLALQKWQLHFWSSCILFIIYPKGACTIIFSPLYFLCILLLEETFVQVGTAEKRPRFQPISSSPSKTGLSILSLGQYVCFSVSTMLLTFVDLYHILQSENVIPPTSFFFLAIALAIWDLLWFHMNFRIIFNSTLKNVIRDNIESIDSFGWYGHFNRIKFYKL